MHPVVADFGDNGCGELAAGNVGYRRLPLISKYKIRRDPQTARKGLLHRSPSVKPASRMIPRMCGWFEVLISMDGNNCSAPRSDVPIDVVTAVDTSERPASLLEDAAHSLARDDLHGFGPAASPARPSS